jgi:hypothetical protein
VGACLELADVFEELARASLPCHLRVLLGMGRNGVDNGQQGREKGRWDGEEGGGHVNSLGPPYVRSALSDLPSVKSLLMS